MKKLLLSLGVLVAASTASADYYNSCQGAYREAQELAFYGQYYQSSVVRDIDRIRDISKYLEQNVRGLQRISYSAKRASNISGIAGRIGNTMDSGIIPKAQESGNKAQNVIGILEAALDKDNVEHLKNHIRRALQHAREAKQLARESAQSAESVKAEAMAIERDVRDHVNEVSLAVREQGIYINKCNDSIKNMTYSLMGSDWWGSSQPSPYSKMGKLKEAMNYLGSYNCLRF